MPQRMGKYTIELTNTPSIIGYAAVVGDKEAKGPLGQCFDKTYKDAFFGEKTFEKAETKMQKMTIEAAIKKSGLSKGDIQIAFAGDLLNQCIGSSFTLRNMGIPHLGLYGACSTMALSSALASVFIASGASEKAIAVTSSHFCSAERQYRFPLNYGSQRTPTAQWTVTGAGAALVSKSGNGPFITHITPGKIVDMGIKDANNMGAIMAPSAAATLHKHLTELNRPINYYDLIVTGDLGSYGSKLFLSLIKQDYNYMPSAYIDAASTLYNNEENEIEGGSGPVVVPLVLFNKILKETNYKKILLLATGSLHSPLMVNLKKSIPSITHAVSIEVIK